MQAYCKAHQRNLLEEKLLATEKLKKSLEAKDNNYSNETRLNRFKDELRIQKNIINKSRDSDAIIFLKTILTICLNTFSMHKAARSLWDVKGKEHTKEMSRILKNKKLV